VPLKLVPATQRKFEERGKKFKVNNVKPFMKQ
jgi:hypothetical protein